MLDLFQINISNAKADPGPPSRFNLSYPNPTDTLKHAKRIIKMFDVSGYDYYGLAQNIFDNAPDGVLIHIYSLVDALIEVAADMQSSGLTSTMIQREIGVEWFGVRRELSRAGYLTHPK